MHSPRRTLLLLLALGGSAAVAACSSSSTPAGSDGGTDAGTDAGMPAAAPAVQVLSSKPEYVSGGDALISSDGTAATLHAKLNGTDVSASFKQDPNNADRMVGLVTGLANGANSLVVDNGGTATTVAMTNWSINGPILSGKQIQPFICQTSAFLLPDGTAFGTAATDASATCSAPTVIQYMYMQKTGTALVPLTSTATVPADCATTTTTAGKTVNFIVRVETGTMDRGIYQNAILFDPTVDTAPSALNPPKGWNRRLVGVHGSGCVGGWYIQGPVMGVSPYADAQNLIRLGEGYAVFTNTLNHPTNSCNAVVAGEATMMGKERFIETFGVPDFTVSTGGSGGAYTSLQVADIYPGLFDGVFINSTFPDALAIAMASMDDKLIYHFYTNSNDVANYTDTSIVSVTGHQGLRSWYDLSLESGRTDPISGRTETIPANALLGAYQSAVFSSAVPTSVRYDPSTNPTGARATVFDVAKAVYGVDSMGRGLRTFDNVGVQYGLAELNAGTITTTQFLELNDKIGGYDSDGNYIATRTVGDINAIQRISQAGILDNTGGGLASIPVFDWSYLYDDSTLYHYQAFRFSVRARLVEANGDSQNHVMWRGGQSIADLYSGTPSDPGHAAIVNYDLTTGWSTFINWVVAYKADTSSKTQRQKVIADKPAAAVDGCFTDTVPPVFQAETQTRASSGAAGSCNAMWPSYSLPRLEAGGPASLDTLKCQLKAVAAADYQITFTSAEMTRLSTIFPAGVCDFSKPGVNKTALTTYGSFGPSTVNPVYLLP